MQTYQELGVGVLSMLSQSLAGAPQIRGGSSDTIAEVYAETEDGMNNPPLGSIYLSLSGMVFLRVAGNEAAADWTIISSQIDTTTIFVSAGAGSDTEGNGSTVAPYATVTTALAAVTSARKIIMIAAGEYAEAGPLVIPTTVSGIQIIGTGTRFETEISAAAGDEVITLAPGVQASTYELTLQNIHVEHSDGQDGLVITNDDMTKKCNIYMGHVGFGGESDDFSIKCVHGDTDNAIRIYWEDGNGDCEGSIDLAQANDGDRFYADRIVIGGDDFDFGTDVAGTVRMRYCQIAYRIFTGGGTTNVATLAWCLSSNSGALLAAADADITTNSSVTGSTIVGT